VLADFANEFHPAPPQFEQEWWAMHVDNSSNRHGGGVGVILEGPNGVVMAQSLHFGFNATCNQAEYEAILVGLRLAKEVGAQRVQCRSHSKIIVE